MKVGLKTELMMIQRGGVIGVSLNVCQAFLELVKFVVCFTCMCASIRILSKLAHLDSTLTHLNRTKTAFVCEKSQHHTTLGGKQTKVSLKDNSNLTTLLYYFRKRISVYAYE